MQLTYTVRNTARAIGARVSSHITRKFGMSALPSDHLTVELKGSAGQSLGAFAVRGLRIVLTGEANDYVGKGLSGATIVVKPSPHLLAPESQRHRRQHLPVRRHGRASCSRPARRANGSAVRNSGATRWSKAAAANGLEYMTGGTSR